MISSASSFSTGNWASNSEAFPDPFLDYASTVFPETIQLALRWCEYLILANGTYRQALDRLLSYFITDLNVTGENIGDDEKKQWTNFLEEKIDYRNLCHIAGLDLGTYGNGFISVIPGFRRYLTCPNQRCSLEAPLKKVFNEPAYAFRWSNFEFHATCPRCKTQGQWRHTDRRSMTADGDITIKRWNPHEMELLWDPLTDQCAYIWKIPEDYRKMIREGHLYHLERATWEVIQAVKHNNYLLFDKDVIYHMRDCALAGVRNRGWGISRVLTNFRQAWYVQVLHRYNEAIALDYVIPFRLLTPAPGDKGAGTDPLLNSNLGGMRGSVESLLRKRRRDPAAWNFLPFPVQYQALGGDATQLAPKDLMDQGMDTLLNSIGVPSEMYRGTMTMQSAPVGLRLFEASNSQIPHALNGLIRFLVTQISQILGWEKPKAAMKRVTHADDVARQQAKLQLMMSGAVSKSTGLESVGVDFQEETARMMDDERYEAEQKAKLQEQMEQSALSQQMAQPQQQGQPGQPAQGGGGAPAGGVQGGDPSQGGAGGAAQSVVANLPQGDDVPISPQELQERARYVASSLMGMQESQKDSELHKLKTIDPTLHSLVKSIMTDMREQARTQGGAQVLSQMFGKQGSPRNPYGLPNFGRRTIVVD